VLRKVGCSLVLVDEVHRLDLRTRKGAAASDELKYFFDSVGATFVYAGLDLAENGMFNGTRGRQLASRFITRDTSAFGYATDKEKADWRMLVATLEDALRLHRHKPGTLVNDAAYLHERTSGMIGSLDQLIHEAANEAIADGTEKITRAHLAAYTGMPRDHLAVGRETDGHSQYRMMRSASARAAAITRALASSGPVAQACAPASSLPNSRCRRISRSSRSD
jgi:hypothetical protein